MSFKPFTEIFSFFISIFFNFIICMEVTEYSMGNVAVGSLEPLVFYEGAPYYIYVFNYCYN